MEIYYKTPSQTLATLTHSLTHNHIHNHTRIRFLVPHMAEEEGRSPLEGEISGVRSSSSGADEPSSSAASSSVGVAVDQTNAQEDARNSGELSPIREGAGVANSENYAAAAAAAAAAEEKHSCCICKNEFKSSKALCGHMRTHPRPWKGVKPPPAAAAAAVAVAAAAATVAAEQQGRDVRESAEGELQGRNVRESAAAERVDIPVRKLVPSNQSAEEVNGWTTDSVVDQLLLLVKEFRQGLQGDDGRSSENNITSENSTAGGGGSNGEVIMKDVFNEPANIRVVAAGVEAGAGPGSGLAVGVIEAACNGTVSDGKKATSLKKKRGSSSTAKDGSGVHRCEICAATFATGQSLGGHMRKHYDGPPIINKKRAREQREETPAPAAKRTVQELAAPTDLTLALIGAGEERMASCFNAPLQSHNPELLLRSVQASDGADYARNREEPEVPSAGNGARRPHAFDLNEPAEPAEEPENAPQPEPERKDDDGDDASLSLRLGPFDFPRSS